MKLAPRATGVFVFTLMASFFQPIIPAHAFLDRILPSTDTKDEFNGRFIDTVTAGEWKPPLEKFLQESAEKSSNGPLGETNDESEPLFEHVSGLTILRMETSGIVLLPVLNGYISRIIERLLVKSPIIGAPVTVHVTTDERYGNALALPDGTIAIPMASILQAGSEDEIAALLGHEIAHVLLGHHDLDWFKDRQENLVASAELMLGLASGVAQQFGQGNEIAAKAARILMVAEVVMATTSKGLIPSWTREHEDEADLLGLDLLVAAGYNPDGMFELIRKMQKLEDDEASKPDPHQKKREALNREIERQGSRANLGGALENALEAAALEFSTAMSRAEASHRGARSRNDSLLEYFDREYADLVPPAMTVQPLEDVRKSSEFIAFEDSYNAASDARDRLAEDDIRSAEHAARRSVSGLYKNHSWTRHGFAQVRLKQGQLDKALQNLELALKDPYAPLAIYEDLEKLYRKTGASKSAEQILTTAWEEFQRPTALYVRVIHNYYRNGEKLRAQELAIECAFKNRSVGKLCRAAAEGRDPDMMATQAWLKSSR